MTSMNLVLVYTILNNFYSDCIIFSNLSKILQLL